MNGELAGKMARLAAEMAWTAVFGAACATQFVASQVDRAPAQAVAFGFDLYGSLVRAADGRGPHSGFSH